MHAKVFFAADTLRITLEPAPPVLTVRLTGELDVGCGDLVRSAATVPAEGVDAVVVDLSGLCFCDLSGVAALHDLRAAHQALGRQVEVVCAQPLLRRILTLIGDDLLFPGDRRGDGIPTAQDGDVSLRRLAVIDGAAHASGSTGGCETRRPRGI